jgi:5-(aminomethyl)-3-furanmethanol phosphate kinase
MITILKIGGSLLESDAAARLMRELAAARPRGLLIVPGGGAFADAVRAAQKQHALGDATAHHMALLAMETVGAMLVSFAPGFVLAGAPDEFTSAWQRGLVPIWSPVRMVLAATEIPASWDVTSDSLAAWLGDSLGAARVILAKSCDVAPLIAADANQLAAAGIVDPAFPRFVEGRNFSWEIASGAAEVSRRVCLASQ